ncbi:MAG: 2-oxoglutarate dehydrogenase [Clostridiales Family XIII bacterium]|jgi:hypothetical protein|nr:2-oxoglutarate dehydrogenase [Clostridiales Family XIII bacterium]
MGRADGRLIKSLPPFTKIIPYIMAQRYDATNFMTVEFPYDKVSTYIRDQKRKGIEISMMACILASLVRTIAKYPEINRFVVAKKIYARKGIWISFVTLKDNWSGEGEQDETVVKLKFTGHETIGVISKMVNDSIDENRKAETSNSMDKLLNSIFSTPILPSAIVSFIKWLDRRGILPMSVINASPFHTSIFFSNLASIKATPVYHHLYEFGTTSEFVALGVNLNNRKSYTLKIATDERVCSGSTFVRAMHYFMKNLRHLDSLEIPPSSVNKDLR